MEVEQNNEIELEQALKEGHSLHVEDGRKVAMHPPKYGTLTIHYQNGKPKLIDRKATFKLD
ncbi:hypothetical protein NHG35_04670 [Aerococcaceae bacterium NML180378]|nr:hypothetical protein [Aerococcaceae bacterium NML180378]